MTDSPLTVSIVLFLTSLIVGLFGRRNPKLALAVTTCGLIIAALLAFFSKTGTTALDQVLTPGQPINWASQRWLVGKGLAIACTLLMFASDLHRHLRWTLLAQLGGLVLICGGTSPLIVLAALQLVIILSQRSLDPLHPTTNDPRWSLLTGLWLTVGIVLLLSQSHSALTEASPLKTLGTILILGSILAQLPISLWNRNPSQVAVASTIQELPVHAGIAAFLWRLTAHPGDLALLIDLKAAQSILVIGSLIVILLSIIMTYRVKVLSDWANVAWLIGWVPLLGLFSLTLFQLEQSPSWPSLRTWPDAGSVAMSWIVFLSLGVSLLLFLEREYAHAWNHRDRFASLEQGLAQGVDQEIIAGWGRQRPILGVSLTVLALALSGAPLTWGFWQFIATIESLATVRVQASLTGFIDPVFIYQFLIIVWGCALAAYGKLTFSWLVCLWAEPIKASPLRERTQIRSLTCGLFAMTIVLLGLVPGPMLRLLVRCQDRSESVVKTNSAADPPPNIKIADQQTPVTPWHD